MKKQSEMEEKINRLEASENELTIEVLDLKNLNKTVLSNNKLLEEQVENVRRENATLLKILNGMELSGQIKDLEKVKHFLCQI